VKLPLEIMGFSKPEQERRAAEVLALVDLEGFARKYPWQLSGGMQQRVGLARALAANPDVLLMDEPFSALDPLIRRQLQDEFIRLSKILKKTTVFITHDLDEAVRIGDRIAIMRDGWMVQTGTAEEIVMNPADDYVADFVAGISRLKVVHAHAIMQPIDAYLKRNGPLGADAPRVGANETLSTLINLAIDHESAIIVSENEKDVGAITRSDILRTVVEGTEMS
jgi:glycine betaine/proline transport system ATP-binding protein